MHYVNKNVLSKVITAKAGREKSQFAGKPTPGPKNPFFLPAIALAVHPLAVTPPAFYKA